MTQLGPKRNLVPPSLRLILVRRESGQVRTESGAFSAGRDEVDCARGGLARVLPLESVTGVHMSTTFTSFQFSFSKFHETKLGRVVTLFVLSASALLTVGCSTPPVNGARVEAKSAYQVCFEQLAIYGREQECHQPAYTNSYQTPSYTQYNQQYRYSYVNGKLTEREDSEIMADYLDTLDDESVKELTTQWKSLADQANLASVSE